MLEPEVVERQRPRRLTLPEAEGASGQNSPDYDYVRKTLEDGVAEVRVALANLNDPLYESCVVCHQNYRPDYGR